MLLIKFVFYILAFCQVVFAQGGGGSGSRLGKAIKEGKFFFIIVIYLAQCLGIEMGQAHKNSQSSHKGLRLAALGAH